MKDLTDKPEYVFGRWAKKYGNVFGFKVGERWMVVLNGQEVIKEALLNHGVEFAGRPDFYSSKKLKLKSGRFLHKSAIGLFYINQEPKLPTLNRKDPPNLSQLNF